MKVDANAFPKLILTEGSAPAPPSSGDQLVFIDSSDHHFKRKNSSGTVVDIEAGGGGGSAQEHNEIAAAVLVGGGGYTDHFTGSALGGAWAQEVNTPTTVVVGNSVYAADPNNVPCYTVQAHAPAGAFRIEGRFQLALGTSDIGLVAKDTRTSESAIEMIVCDYDGGGNLRLLKHSGGSCASIGSLAHAPPLGVWFYLRLERGASNDWTSFYSYDRAFWHPIASGSFTLTVAKSGIRTGGAAGAVGSCDFVDCVS